MMPVWATSLQVEAHCTRKLNMIRLWILFDMAGGRSIWFGGNQAADIRTRGYCLHPAGNCFWLSRLLLSSVWYRIAWTKKNLSSWDLHLKTLKVKHMKIRTTEIQVTQPVLCSHVAGFAGKQTFCCISASYVARSGWWPPTLCNINTFGSWNVARTLLGW